MTQKKPEWLGSADFLIIDYIKDGVVLLDLKGKIIRTNKRVLAISGYPKKEFEGKAFKLLKMFPPKSIAKMLMVYKKVLSGQNVLPFDVEFFAKSGKKKVLEISGNLVKIKNKPVGIVVLFRDITGHKKAERELKTSEDRFRTLVENAPIGIYYNGFDGTFLYGNKEAERIVGYKSKDLIGKSFLELKLLGPTDVFRGAKLLALNKLGRGTGPDEFTLNRKDGSKWIIEITTRIITISGKKAVMGMVKDVTEREKGEEARTKKEELERFNKLAVGRELRMVELKKRIKYLERLLGERDTGAKEKRGE